MAIRAVLQYPQDEDALRKKSALIKRLDDETRALIQDLKDTLLAQSGAGLAAPQIGVHVRATAVRFGQGEGEMQPPIVLLNPVIVQRGPMTKSFDGCLSMPGLVTWDVMRPSWLVYTARDEAWKQVRRRVEGIDAALVEHEVDHLNGVLFLDKLDGNSKLYLSRLDEDGKEKLVQVTAGFSGRLVRR